MSKSYGGIKSTVILPSKKSKIAKRRHRKRKVQAVGPPKITDIPGLYKLRLSEDTQRAIGCVIGEDVTTEHPWICIDKELILEDLEINDENSDFISVKPHVENYTNVQVLVGYVADTETEYDEFYVCLTAEAQDAAMKVIETQREEQERRLLSSIEKYPRTWTSYGSEIEIDSSLNVDSRPLLEVYVESKYPIMSSKVQFKIRAVDAVRDGYIQILVPASKAISNIFRRKLDAAVQVAPMSVEDESQTVCTFPQNKSTQYEYIMEECTSLTPAFLQSLAKYNEQNWDSMSDWLRVNSVINLYSHDYTDLVKDEKYAKAVTLMEIKEELSFTDINLCKGKMIGSAAWHYMLSGIVAISYMDVPTNVYIHEPINVDEVNRIVHGQNPVLIWSYNDALHAKLQLESNREVTFISCCPYDSNIIVGGLANGQVVMWDIRMRLENVETSEILTIVQQDYRKRMFALINWMKIIKNLKLVSATVTSELEFSHKEAVSCVEWLSPYHEISNTGHIKKLEEPSAMQFVTSSHDGTVLFWDLHQKLRGAAAKARKKLRRLKERPAALTADVSPYRELNRMLRPIYKLNFVQCGNIFHPITAFHLGDIVVEYECHPGHMTNDFATRVEYKTYIPESSVRISQSIVVGTAEGDFISASWNGFDYSAGEPVNQENCKINNIARYHDGPVVSIRRWSAESDIILTVGGTIFAIWKETLLGRPLLWRKSNTKYTQGTWSLHDKSTVRLMTYDGTAEIWNLQKMSQQSFKSQSLSGFVLTGCYSEPMGVREPIVGISDYRGSFRVYTYPKAAVRITMSCVNKFSRMLDRCIKRTTGMHAWQSAWKEKFATLISEQKEHNRLARELKDEKKALLKQHQKPEVEEEIFELPKRISKIEIPKPGDYKKRVEARYVESEKRRMDGILLAVRQLDPELLQKQQIPLKKLEREQAAKKRKQRRRLHKAEQIFKENVYMNFPKVLEKPRPPPIDPYAGGDSPDAKEACYDEYNKHTTECTKYIANHPFYYEFNWHELLKEGHERRRVFDLPYGLSNHKERYQNYLKMKADQNSKLQKDYTTYNKSSTFSSMTMSKMSVDVENDDNESEIILP